MKGSNGGGMRDLEDRRLEGVEADGAVENFRVDDAADARRRRGHVAHLLRPLMGIPFPPLLAAAALIHCWQVAAVLVHHHDLAVKKCVACSILCSVSAGCTN